ncbi:hypothetical protein DPMN_110596 [Dreissena polymorpha]|uniref:Uncharacterized protein n=1 Tax=Dreissena polymorpha TaxID=45954 RepID=A0A9D4KCP2_DREPO|nr:hypothetical protein DPMN_110596 [Dreissena polymorpha]
MHTTVLKDREHHSFRASRCQMKQKYVTKRNAQVKLFQRRSIDQKYRLTKSYLIGCLKTIFASTKYCCAKGFRKEELC